MAAWRLRDGALPRPREARWRFAFTLLTLATTAVLLAWGGFVTSIEAGLAVPDWPTTFGSMDPFETGFEDPNDPTARWYDRLPILAEHGHRLLGALVGALTLLLAGWTWLREPRRWIRGLALGALVLVIGQGILGGLRVTEVSLVMAMIHACVAQIFFALLVALALFVSKTWQQGGFALAPTSEARRLRRLAVATAGVIYLQIVLGALLRHFGTGVDPLFAMIHITGAFVVVGLVAATVSWVRRAFDGVRVFERAAWALFGAVGLQFVLGVLAFLVLLYETQAARRSTLQIVLNSAHLVVGGLLLAAAVVLALLSLRRRRAAVVPTAPPTLATEPAAAAGVSAVT